jgi:two-component system NarL family response regulator
MSESRLRLVLGDDHHLMVEALRTALSVKYDVVAIGYTAEEIVAAVRTQQPDLLLLDLSLPGRNGLELIPELLAHSSHTRIIVVTMHLDRLIAESSLRKGAHGFVPKDAGLEELDRAIQTVWRGESYISTRVPPSTNRVAMDATHAALAALTPRQHEIIRMVADGLTSTEIAKRLGLSERTVAFHRTNIRAKLGIESDGGLLRYALLLRLNGD